MAERLTGAIEKIVFHNLENGYCVFRATVRGHGDGVTIVGHLPSVVAGEYFDATGDWVTDRQFGMQFKATELKTTPPHTAEGIVKFLGSGLIKGIGPTYARKIVDRFGEKTLDVIDQSVSHLAQVKGIGPKRLALIREGWKESMGVRSIMVFLQSYGIGTSRAIRIYKTYGDTAIDQVRANPYQLSTDIWGIGFKIADELALKIGIARDAPKRIQAAVRHVLQEASGQGHLALPEAMLIEQTIALTEAAADHVANAIEQLRIENEVIRDEMVSSPERGVTSLIYLTGHHQAEVGIAQSLTRLRAGVHPIPDIRVEKAIEWAEGRMGITFAPQQRAAIAAACRNKILVLTGGPGTGKTTIIRAIIDIFQAKKQRVALAAPTGRAAKRLAESTQREAKTIHRLLEFDPAVGHFRRGSHEPLDVDLLVIDETSMVDAVLMNSLLRAVPPFACLVFVGDVDQLPSVGPGSVLADFIASQTVPVVRLTEVHRQAATSWIVRAAHAINQGQEPESSPVQTGDFHIVEADEPTQIVDRILTMVTERIPARFQLDPVNDVQILCPMNKTEIGVHHLNQRLQAALTPGGPGIRQIERYGTSFRVGDKVIQTRNNYQRETFNGDIGRILAIHDVDQIVELDFDSRRVEYEFSELDELQLAYAITIHKSQGSEYPAVIIPVHTQNFVMLQRNLLYTGVTRGRSLVVLVGSRKALWIAVNKAEASFRYSQLAERLKSALRGSNPL